MELVPGEKVRAIDLVYACMMMSANDGATALAEAVSGDVASFAKLMNDTAASWGCTDTNFVNANGWDNRKHYTSAHDMEIITRKCLENDTLRDISMTKYYTVPATNKGDALFMENALLKTMDDMRVLTGGKTGSWSETQCSIALEFREKGLSGVIVLLDDTMRGRAEDVRKLIAYSHEVIPGFLVTRNGETVCEANVKHGAQRTVALTADRKGYAYPASGKADDVKVKTSVRELKAPVKKGEIGGYYFVYANDKLAYKGKLLTAESVDESRMTKRLKKLGIR
jgi:D-alanyl-D-alanine carboxypeptidase